MFKEEKKIIGHLTLSEGSTTLTEVTTTAALGPVGRLMQLLYVRPKFGLSISATVDAVPQKRAVSDGRDHRTKPPIHGRRGPLKAREAALSTKLGL